MNAGPEVCPGVTPGGGKYLKRWGYEDRADL
jgi:hypothetical protein